MSQLFEEKISVGHLKECPICHEKCFADMEVCFGCLYRFTDEDNKKVFTSSGESKKVKEKFDNLRGEDRPESDISLREESRAASTSQGNVEKSDLKKTVVEKTVDIVDYSGIAGFEITVQVKPISKSPAVFPQ